MDGTPITRERLQAEGWEPMFDPHNKPEHCILWQSKTPLLMVDFQSEDKDTELRAGTSTTGWHNLKPTMETIETFASLFEDEP